MSSGSLEIPVLTVLILIAAAFVFPDAGSMAMSRRPAATVAGTGGSGEGTACELPPDVDIGSGGTSGRSPLLDERETGDYETATFAMG